MAVPALADAAPPPASQPAKGATDAKKATIEIDQYVVDGVHLLSQADVENAVYDYLGPGRTVDDVEKARVALEKLYQSKGYQTVSVEIPPQKVENGVVVLKVVEAKVGRLRVKGSQYFSIDEIKDEAPSLAEGKVPNFNDVSKDIYALNMLPDRQVTPSMRAGTEPGVVDVDLNVKDSLPVHGSVELNNRYSANTTPLRLTNTLSDDNLWQLGHSLSLTYQVAPQNPGNAEVFSASYTARIPSVPWFSLLVYGVINNSNVAVLSDTNVVGRGNVSGIRAIATLPGDADFSHSISAGFDYKHFDQNIVSGGATISTPISYDPISIAYSATWQGDRSTTQFDNGLTFHFREFGSNPAAFVDQRTGARGDFVYLRDDLSRTQELPLGFEAYGKIQGQIASGPLVNNEQFSAGGVDTVRGYLESEALGDFGGAGSLELRSPSASNWFNRATDHASVHFNEWRAFAFVDGGHLVVIAPEPGQQSVFDLLSVGVGTGGKVANHVEASIDLGLPLIDETYTRAGSPLVNFRLTGEF